MNILIIEDDKETALNILKGLIELGHSGATEHNGKDGLKNALNNNYDVIIVDRMLPGISGTEIIKSLRKELNTTPTLILSAMTELDEKIEGFDAGADDYLAKPFAFSELVARLTALSKRNTNNISNKIKIGDLEIDKLKRSVFRAGQEIHLQPREFELLAYLMTNKNIAIPRDVLLKEVWDFDFDTKTNIVDVHISRLRNKIDKDFDENMISTIRGAGYMISKYEPV